jgi:hypothetical protein
MVKINQKRKSEQFKVSSSPIAPVHKGGDPNDQPEGG